MVQATGNRYILTISDYFTRFGWAKALPTKEAEGVVSALKEVCTINFIISNGIMYILLSSFLFIALLFDGNSICDNHGPREGVPE